MAMFSFNSPLTVKRILKQIVKIKSLFTKKSLRKCRKVYLILLLLFLIFLYRKLRKTIYFYRQLRVIKASKQVDAQSVTDDNTLLEVEIDDKSKSEEEEEEDGDESIDENDITSKIEEEIEDEDTIKAKRLFHNNKLFSFLNPLAQKELFSLMSLHSVAAGDMLFNINDTVEGLYIIHKVRRT